MLVGVSGPVPKPICKKAFCDGKQNGSRLGGYVVEAVMIRRGKRSPSAVSNDAEPKLLGSYR